MRLTQPLIHFSRSNDERKVTAYITAGAYPNGQPGPDGTAIHAAAASGHANIVNLLLKREAAIDARGPSGITPLQSAAVEGHTSVVKLLIHKGAKVDLISKLHGTAVCAAISRARFDVIRVLLKNGAMQTPRMGHMGTLCKQQLELAELQF